MKSIIVMVLLWAAWGGGLVQGMDRSSRLALDAYQREHDAWYLVGQYEERMARYLGISERAVLVCIREIEGPSWHVDTTTVIDSSLIVWDTHDTTTLSTTLWSR